MAVKKVPMRMCIGCREMKPKKELIRVVKTAEKEIKIDLVGKMNGRGAYVCKNKDCLQKAHKSNALSRAFEMNVSPEVYQGLETELENAK